MAEDGVYADNLIVGDVVRIGAEAWRVSRVDRCGPDEVEIVFVNPGDNDQLTMNLRSGEIMARVY